MWKNLASTLGGSKCLRWSLDNCSCSDGSLPKSFVSPDLRPSLIISMVITAAWIGLKMSWIGCAGTEVAKSTDTIFVQGCVMFKVQGSEVGEMWCFCSHIPTYCTWTSVLSTTLPCDIRGYRVHHPLHDIEVKQIILRIIIEYETSSEIQQWHWINIYLSKREWSFCSTYY